MKIDNIYIFTLKIFFLIKKILFLKYQKIILIKN